MVEFSWSEYAIDDNLSRLRWIPVEVKFLLERPVAYPPLALQQGHHQGEYAIYSHPRISLLS